MADTRLLCCLLPILALTCTSALAADAPAPPPPPPPAEEAPPSSVPAPPGQPSEAQQTEAGVPEVKIIQQGAATVEEYRLNGKLYKVKVIPKVGPPYYLLYPQGPAGPTVRQEIEGADLQTPFWVIFSW